MLTSLETALSEYGLLLCNARRPIPGLPCLSEEQRETVWDEDTQSYLSVTSWGLAKPLYAYYNELSYELRDFTPLFLLVRPKEGVSPPRAQVPKPGYAVLDTTTGITTVYVGSSNARSDGGSKESDEQPINAVPVHNVRLNLDNLSGGDNVLQHIRYALARAGVPVYPTGVYAVESTPYPWEWETGNADFRTARVFNKEVGVPLVGYATDDMNEIVYLHIVGHKSAIRSIWATLNSSGRKPVTIDAPHDYGRRYSTHNYVTYSAPVDTDTGLYRLLIVDRRATAQEVDRAYLLVYKGNDTTEADIEANIDLAFAARLNAVLPIPILPQWGRRLRQEGEGVEKDMVQACAVGGDVAAAYIITPDPRWIELVESLVQSGELTL